MVLYKNGQIPAPGQSGSPLFVVPGGTGYDSNGYWEFQITAMTWKKWQAAKKYAETHFGRTLYIRTGWNVYRPYSVQVTARRNACNAGNCNGASVPGYSSHGGNWGGRDCLAIDVNPNGLTWNQVWEACRSAGFAVGLITQAISGIPGGEPWHIIDFDAFVPVPAGGGGTPIPPSSGGGGTTKPTTEEDEIMAVMDQINAQFERTIDAVRREGRWRKFGDTEGRYAIGREGSVIRLPEGDGSAAMASMAQIAANNPLMFPAGELNGSQVVLDPTAFFSLVDGYRPEGDSGYGKFVKNYIDLTVGKTFMVRANPNTETHYASRYLVWANARPVELQYNGKVITDLKTVDGKKSAVLADGTTVALTDVEAARADAQTPAGQNWT